MVAEDGEGEEPALLQPDPLGGRAQKLRGVRPQAFLGLEYGDEDNQCPEFKFGFVFFPFKCCVSQLSVDRSGNKFEGVMTLGQVKSSPNFCSFGPQRAEKHNI